MVVGETHHLRKHPYGVDFTAPPNWAPASSPTLEPSEHCITSSFGKVQGKDGTACGKVVGSENGSFKNLVGS